MSTNHPEAPHPPEPNLLPPKPIPVHPASALAVLTPDEREQLFDWLETLPIHDVLAKVAARRPHGFAIQTHVTTLRRFHTRARAHAQRQIAEDAAYINEIENPSPASPAHCSSGWPAAPALNCFSPIPTTSLTSRP